MNLLKVLFENVPTPRYYLSSFGNFYRVLQTFSMCEKLLQRILQFQKFLRTNVRKVLTTDTLQFSRVVYNRDPTVFKISCDSLPCNIQKGATTDLSCAI